MLQDPVTEYANLITTGQLPANTYHRLACERHLRDMQRAVASDFPYYLDLNEVSVRIEFFRWLRHIEGNKFAGKPIELELWQQFIIGSVFGWKDRHTGLRRFNTAYEEVPRKNGKSTKTAGVALMLAFFDREEGAQVVCAATKRDQALIVWGTASTMVRRSPQLAKRIRRLKASLSIEARSQTLKPLGADADTTDGLNVHGAVVDEVHAHLTRAMVDVLETATGARLQPLVYYITTAGMDQRSVCWELRKHSIAVLEGTWVDETWFAFVTGMDEGDDWTQPATWRKANPNFGVSVSESDLQRKVNRAVRSPEARIAFQCKHLNVWIAAAGRSIEPAQWDQPGNQIYTWQQLRERLKGRKVQLGLDLASTQDLAAAACVWEEEEGRVFTVPFYWIPRDRLNERVKRDRVQYDAWLADDLLIATPGATIDYNFIRRFINGLPCRIAEIGYDPWNAVQLAVDLGPDGDGFNTLAVNQNKKNLNEPTKTLLDLVVSGRLVHGGHPILRWNALNLVCKRDAEGNLKPDKENSIDKIDGITATIDGMFSLFRTPTARKSVYAKRGVHVMGGDE